ATLACQRINNPVAECRKVPSVHVIEQSPGNASVEIEIRMKAGLGSTPPSFALWSENRQGTPTTIYVTCKAAKGYEGNNVNNHQDLPVWNKARSSQNLTPESPELDAVTTATPTRNSFLIHWEPVTHNSADTIKLFLEVNLPYDYNNFFTRNMGTNGQPSLIYGTAFTIQPDTLLITQSTRIMGRGHHQGQTNQIYPDLTGITTALDIIEGLLVRRIN
ncbi:MAG: hypothetical protein R6V75_07865, partial [Bacteroidales bacterium]